MEELREKNDACVEEYQREIQQVKKEYRLKYVRQVYQDKCNIEELEEYKKKYRRFVDATKKIELENKCLIHKLNQIVDVYMKKYRQLFE